MREDVPPVHNISHNLKLSNIVVIDLISVIVSHWETL